MAPIAPITDKTYDYVLSSSHSSLNIISILLVAEGFTKLSKLISQLESLYGVNFENVYVYSKSLQQPNYQYLKELLIPLNENVYFIFINNYDVIPPSEARTNSQSNIQKILLGSLV